MTNRRTSTRRRTAAGVLVTIATLFATVGGAGAAHATPVGGGVGSMPTTTSPSASPSASPTPTEAPASTTAPSTTPAPPSPSTPATPSTTPSSTPSSATPSPTPTASEEPTPATAQRSRARVALAPGAAAIEARYNGDAAVRSKLGAPTGAAQCNRPNGGCLQTYRKGAMYWTPSTGAHFTLYGVVNSRYVGAGREGGALGYPTTDYACDQPKGGCKQSYQKGHVYWSSATGARIVMGGNINYAWLKAGGPGGTLGYPTSDQVNGLRDGGSKQRFRNGTIYTSAASGTHYTVAGNINYQYQKAGEEAGKYRYPRGKQSCSGGVCRQSFQGGTLVHDTRPKPAPPKVNVDSRCKTGRVMCASKKDRKMRWMIDGKVIKTYDARFGCSRTPSDNGQFRVFWKSYNHTSTIYGTWMPRAMFYNGGEAVHYSGDFAARGWNGCSGGCVNIRDFKGIDWLYSQVRVGDKVVVY